jgi:hypothetical protein
MADRPGRSILMSDSGTPNRIRLVFPREVILVEIERRCQSPGCDSKNQIALTKTDAPLYFGFECKNCGTWNSDTLSERDAPEWWSEERT